MAPDDTPQTPPSGELNQPGARAYNDLGQVRPADGRFLGDNSDDVEPQDLEAIRQRELEVGYERLLAQRKAEEEENQRRLEEAGYKNPTTEKSQFSELANAAAAKAGEQSSETVTDDPADKYSAMDYPALQAEARDRDGVKGNLPADELRAALRADDEAKG